MLRYVSPRLVMPPKLFLPLPDVRRCGNATRGAAGGGSGRRRYSESVQTEAHQSIAREVGKLLTQVLSALARISVINACNSSASNGFISDRALGPHAFRPSCIE